MPSRFVRFLFLALVPALLTATASALPPSNGGSSPPLVVSASRLVSMRHGFFRTGYGFRWFPLGMSWVDGSTHGKWRDQFDGYGRVGVRIDGARVLSEIPKAPIGPSDTHAALVTSLRTFGNVDLILRMRTLRQLRWPGANPWEVGWVLWHYTDSTHFYYLILKPNGWGLGKEDPAYPDNQRFLITRSSPPFRIGSLNGVRIRQVGNRLTIWVNGRKVGSFADYQRPYLHGSVGLYCEDSQVEFGNVRVAQL